MADLETRFRGLDRVRGPDLWGDIEAREARPMPDGGTGRRVAVAAVALILAAGGAVLVARAFLGGDRVVERPVHPAESPAAPVDPVVDVTLPIKWPSSIVYGEGSIWVAASANDGTPAGTIYRIDPDTAEILAEIPTPVVPGWETGGGSMEVAQGDLWVAGGGASRKVVRIDSQSDQVVSEFPVRARFLGDLEIDEHGLWVTAFDEEHMYLLRLDPTTGAEEARVPLEGSYAREVVSVDGTLWVHQRQTHGSTVGASVLVRVDPATASMAEVRVGSPASSVVGGDGFIWAITWTAEDGNLLLRVDPHTGEVVTFPSESLEFVIDVGEGGIWGVARRGQDLFEGRGGIVRFDPVTGRVDAGVDIEAGTIALAVAPGSVWVVGYEEGVTRIELRPQ
jgi:streptogramin lyase